jgi:hypothetical protein
MGAENEKYQIGTKSGNILWDISELKNSIEKGNYKISEMNVKELVSYNFFNGNSHYAMETDISNPCIVVELCDGKDKLIDGNHRLYKANKLRVETINCYYLTKTEHIKYIIEFDSDFYDKVVNEF